jgi:sensor histidine kinase regulating citrate/malate metabolism
MATVTNVVMTADNGLVQCGYTYDSVSLLITTVFLDNQSGAGQVTLTVIDPTTQAVLFGPLTRAENLGLDSRNISGQKLHMVHQTGTNKFGPYDVLVPPVIFDATWHGNAVR